MKIEMIKCPTVDDWNFAKRCALKTVGKTLIKAPTLDWKHRILKARHSPVRTLNFAFEIDDIPSYVSVHLCRHVHSVPFVGTQRNDRQNKYDRRKAPQDTPVGMIWYMNAEELMNVANKRLCACASEETRQVVREICDIVLTAYPEFDGLLVPACEYHGGTCHEMFSCGRYDNHDSEGTIEIHSAM